MREEEGIEDYFCAHASMILHMLKQGHQDQVAQKVGEEGEGTKRGGDDRKKAQTQKYPKNVLQLTTNFIFFSSTLYYTWHITT